MWKELVLAQNEARSRPGEAEKHREERQRLDPRGSSEDVT
jgi:hypothetical protein